MFRSRATSGRFDSRAASSQSCRRTALFILGHLVRNWVAPTLKIRSNNARRTAPETRLTRLTRAEAGCLGFQLLQLFRRLLLGDQSFGALAARVEFTESRIDDSFHLFAGEPVSL